MYVKFKAKMKANESTPLLKPMEEKMEKDECFAGLIQDAKSMLETMRNLEKLNAHLDLEDSNKGDALIKRTLAVLEHRKNKELEDVLSEMIRVFDNIRFKESAVIISICR